MAFLSMVVCLLSPSLSHSHHATPNCGTAQAVVLCVSNATQLQGEEVGHAGLPNQ